MTAIRLGDVTVTSVVGIGRSSFPTASMLPDSTPEAVATHYSWLKPHFFDETVGDLGSCIQTYIVRTPRHTVVIDTDPGRALSAAGLHCPRGGWHPLHPPEGTGYLGQDRSTSSDPTREGE